MTSGTKRARRKPKPLFGTIPHPKFNVGQVVRDGAMLFQIAEREWRAERDSWMYRDIWSWRFEKGLRRLTEREAGR